MGNRVWKDGSRRAIAYVEDKESAEKVMTMTGRRREEGSPATAPGVSVRRPRVAACAAGASTSRSAAEQAKADAAMEGAMAVYSDRRGKPFAWQIPFDAAHWEAVTVAIGAEVLPTLPAPPTEPAAAMAKQRGSAKAGVSTAAKPKVRAAASGK
jgi:hypothetical protein